MNDKKQMVESAVVFYFLHNRLALDNRIAPLIARRTQLLATEDPSLHGDIEAEFIQAVKQEIATKISDDLKAPADEVYEIIEPMDVQAFLNKV